MNIKLIALDMDGTVLLNDHTTITPRTLKTVQAAIDQGIEVVPASGRVLSILPRAFRQLRGINYALTSNGASVVNIHTGETIYHNAISEEPSRQLLRLLTACKAVPEVYYGGKPLIQSGHLDILRASGEKLNQVILDHLTPVDNLAAAMEGKCIEKINLVCIDPANRAAILSGLEAIRGISFIVFDTSIEINSATATKGDALTHLCRFLDIPLEDAMAIGDSDNDLAMLEAAGWSFAMRNASPLARRTARFQTLSIEQDGVAHAIERYVLRRPATQRSNTPLIAAAAAFDRHDAQRINHFMKVYAYAKTIGEGEYLEDTTQFILETAAILHDIGIKPALEKYNSCAGPYQEKEGPAPAREILRRLRYPEPVIERVCYLIAHHHTYSGIDGMDYQILLEADFLVNAWESSMSTEQIQSACEHIFQTETGRTLLNDLFLLP